MVRVVGEEEEMEASIWGRLPDELLERVLALLPLRALISLRRTCRRFRSLLLTPAFLSLLPNHARPRRACQSSSSSFSSSPRSSPPLAPLRPLLRSWARPLPSLLSYFSSERRASSRSCSSSIHATLHTNQPLPAGGGRSEQWTIAGATLSPAASRRPTATSACPAQDPARWSSSTTSEATPAGLFPSASSASSSRRPATARRGALLPRGTLFRHHGALPLVPSTWALQGTWFPPRRLSPLPPAPRGLAFALVGRQARAGAGGAGERLFLVGGVGRDGITRSVCVWELLPLGGGGGGWRWAEAGRLPEMMCRKLVGVCYHNYAHVYCAWHGGGAAGAGGAAVCVCCATWPEVLAFRVGRATWHWLPRCPLLRDKWSCGFRWFSFAPDLYALV
ncbi:F-box/kelch-repeat protein At5g43190 [Ananas comosus]|uniref:F-box/kelch-repeat protein At5g43190 n=1 Tax=Ananas comosus TaxID=4615 RepID=A0A6P5FU70_ANACO|nr:F-box/kelch-repeat protein At5g43190 [Ananas comosus]